MRRKQQVLTWENADWADGPTVARFLDERVNKSHHPDWVGRSLCRWRNGSYASFQALDKVLCQVDIHPSELPEECWVPKPASVHRPPQFRRKRVPGAHPKLSREQADEIRSLSRRGVPRRVVAARFGVSVRTVSHIASGATWGKKAAA